MHTCHITSKCSRTRLSRAADFGVMNLTHNQIKWALFIASVALLPVWFFIVFGFILSPVLPLLINSLLSLTSGEHAYFLLLIHCLFWLIILFLVAVLIARKLSKKKADIKLLTLSAILGVILLLSIAPINGTVSGFSLSRSHINRLNRRA